MAHGIITTVPSHLCVVCRQLSKQGCHAATDSDWLYNLVCDECICSLEPLSLFTVWTVKEEGGECTEEEWGQEEE